MAKYLSLNKIIYGVLFAAIMLVPVSSAMSQELWNGAVHGMSRQNVFDRFPLAHENGNSITGLINNDLILDKVDIGIANVKVEFKFGAHDTLEEVWMIQLPISNGIFDALNAMDSKLFEDQLRKKYGKPKNVDGQLSWVNNGRKITVTLGSVRYESLKAKSKNKPLL